MFDQKLQTCRLKWVQAYIEGQETDWALYSTMTKTWGLVAPFESASRTSRSQSRNLSKAQGFQCRGLQVAVKV